MVAIFNVLLTIQCNTLTLKCFTVVSGQSSESVSLAKRCCFFYEHNNSNHYICVKYCHMNLILLFLIRIDQLSEHPNMFCVKRCVNIRYNSYIPTVGLFQRRITKRRTLPHQVLELLVTHRTKRVSTQSVMKPWTGVYQLLGLPAYWTTISGSSCRLRVPTKYAGLISTFAVNMEPNAMKSISSLIMDQP